VDTARNCVRVNVFFLNQETSVELALDQVARI